MSTPELTQEQAWAEVDRCADGTLRMAYRWGQALIEAKEVTPHGLWLVRLGDRGISRSTAHAAMQIAEEMSETEFLEHGSKRAALAAVVDANVQRAGHLDGDGVSAGAAVDQPLDPQPGGHDGAVQGDLLNSGTEAALPPADTAATEPDVSPQPELPPHLAHGDSADDYDYDAAEAAAAERGDEAADGQQRQLRPESRQHPATFGSELFPVFAKIVWQEVMVSTRPVKAAWRILDPMAGEGSILDIGHASPLNGSDITLHIEASDITEWTYAREKVRCIDATDLDWPDDTFDFIITSPPYANRMADRLSIDGDNRVTYADRRGTNAEPNDASGLQWGPAYQTLMATILVECWRVLAPGGLFVLDCKDHVRQHEMVPVTEWYLRTLLNMGGDFHALRHTRSPGHRGTANATDEFRLGETTVMSVRKPKGEPE